MTQALRTRRLVRYPAAIESRPPGTDSDVAEITRVVGCMNEFPSTIHKLQRMGRMRGQPAVARARSVPQGEQQRKAAKNHTKLS